jgi:hypothetical protein
MTLSEYIAANKVLYEPWITISQERVGYSAGIYTEEDEPPEYEAFGEDAIHALAALLDVIGELPSPSKERAA